MKKSAEIFSSTYRLQLHKDFTFQDAENILPYLADLGISHVYLSPILESRPGSLHGYDGVNPEKISEERGGAKGFDRLMQSLKNTKGLKGCVLDIVPNHLGVHETNPAWWDVLARGPKSKFYKHFDLKTEENPQVVLPVLGSELEQVLKNNEIEVFQNGDGDWILRYYELNLPLAEESLSMVSRAENAGTLNHPETLKKILKLQHYSLQEWRSGSLKINYRRFFDINDLIGLRMEDERVFDWYHSLLSSLMKKYPLIQGLRIDHVDGLTDPESYLHRLAQKNPNIWVEKILGEGEELPCSWPVLGTTGYEFSKVSARLFADIRGLYHLHSFYLKEIDDRWEHFHECVYDSKREVLSHYFVSELNHLTTSFYSFARQPRFSQDDLREVIAALTSALRVYRTYAKKGQVTESAWLKQAFEETEVRTRAQHTEAFDWLKELLLKPGTWSEKILKTIKRWEQLTGPVMAKGLEDTALYRYYPLLSLNGVGGELDWWGDGTAEFHQFQIRQFQQLPMNMNASSTHDTKRSEDVRSRISVLSELAEEWTALCHLLKIETSSEHTPTLKSAYLIFETIVGAWPMDDRPDKKFVRRLKEYFIKAAREAKSETSWREVNEDYERKLLNFVDSILQPKTTVGKAALLKVKQFARKCSFFGAFNSLGLLTLKATAPGFPDFYQGCDLWDLSLVDPDNRRPIDFELRWALLKDIQEEQKKNPRELGKNLVRSWKDGGVKLWLTWRLLQARRQHEKLFSEGEYLAFPIAGNGHRHFISYFRRYKKTWLWVTIPQLLAREEKVHASLDFQSQYILEQSFSLPEGAPKKWKSVLTEEIITGKTQSARSLFKGLPVAVYIGTD